MPVNLNLKIEKKHLYLLSAILIFLVGVGVVIAATPWTDRPQYHSGQGVKVTIGGIDYSLQDAITGELIGGGGAVTCYDETTSRRCPDDYVAIWCEVGTTGYAIQSVAGGPSAKSYWQCVNTAPSKIRCCKFNP